ncbi:MAG: cell division protein ZapA [Ruminococcus sp.]|nr:cell division protein ZapA [Ruminococcus sp.]
MNIVNKVKVTICGKDYSLQTDETPEYIVSLAARTEKQIFDLIKLKPGFGIQNASVFVALTSLDEAQKAQNNIENIRAQIKLSVSEAGKARAAKEKLAAKVKELEERIKELEKENKELKKRTAFDCEQLVLENTVTPAVTVYAGDISDKSADSGDNAKSGKSADSVKAGDSGKSADNAKAVDNGTSADNAKAVDNGKSADSAKVVDNGKTGENAKSVDNGMSAESAKPTVDTVPVNGGDVPSDVQKSDDEVLSGHKSPGNSSGDRVSRSQGRYTGQEKQEGQGEKSGKKAEDSGKSPQINGAVRGGGTAAAGNGNSSQNDNIKTVKS